MMKYKKILQLLTTFLFFLFLTSSHNAFAYTMGSSNFTVEGGNFDVGGGMASSANYLLHSVAGEDYLSAATGANYINNPGLAFVPSPTSTPVPASSASTTAASTAAGQATTACGAAKPGSAPVVSNAAAGTNSTTLTWSKADSPVTHYLIAYGNTSGSIQYGNPNVGGADTTSYTVSGLSGGTIYYFKVKAINDCMPGDFSNEVSVSPFGAAIEAPAEGFVPASELPSQLFDIALIIDNPLIEDSRNLKVRVTFFSFGTEATPVDMEFVVLNDKGGEVYKTSAQTSIQTEGVYNQTFDDLIISDGTYTLLLKTFYSVDVSDEFRAAFEVRSGKNILDWFIPWGLVGILVTLLFIFRILRRRRGAQSQGKGITNTQK